MLQCIVICSLLIHYGYISSNIMRRDLGIFYQTIYPCDFFFFFYILMVFVIFFLNILLKQHRLKSNFAALKHSFLGLFCFSSGCCRNICKQAGCYMQTFPHVQLNSFETALQSNNICLCHFQSRTDSQHRFLLISYVKPNQLFA